MRVGPIALSLVAVALVASGSALAQDTVESCIRCHRVIDEERYSDPVREYESDVHAAFGFGCVACHGGNGRALGPAAKDRSMGYIGIPARQEVPELCGRCHSDGRFMRRFDPSFRVDQVSEYRTSVHGQRLFELGDPNVAICTSCHTAHSIRPPSDPRSPTHPLEISETCGGCHGDPDYMAEYDIPTDQLDRYHESVHYEMLTEGGDLSAPTCNDCHGNHGAAPPEVEWIGRVCGTCHAAEDELFESSAHPDAFARLGKPGCAGCHGNHAIERAGDALLGLDEGSVCGECHVRDEPEGEATLVMRALIDSLKREMHGADSLLVAAEHAGMEVSNAQFELEDARSALVRARTITHAASADSVRNHVEKGLEVAWAGIESGRGAFGELRFRRLGLAVSSLIIVVLIGAIVIKIRERKPTSNEGETDDRG